MPICPFIGLSISWRRPVPICPFIGLSAQAGADLSVYRFIGLSAQAGADLSVYRFIGLSAQAGKNRPCHHAGSLAKFPDATHPGSIIDILLVDAIMALLPERCHKYGSALKVKKRPLERELT